MRYSLAFLGLSVIASAGLVDRVAVVVGNQVITETELLEEVRVTEFLNGAPLDLGPEQRRAAAERLVDQQLIRRDMEAGGYPKASPEEGEKMLAELKKRYGTEAQYHAALAQYGVTEDDLRQHLAWQLAVIQFTDARFRPLVASAPDAPNSGEPASRGEANRAASGSEVSDDAVDRQLEAWLKEARSGTRIQFKKEVFQ